MVKKGSFTGQSLHPNGVHCAEVLFNFCHVENFCFAPVYDRTLAFVLLKGLLWLLNQIAGLKKWHWKRE